MKVKVNLTSTLDEGVMDILSDYGVKIVCESGDCLGANTTATLVCDGPDEYLNGMHIKEVLAELDTCMVRI
jgi:hypothetical protein